jgi:predicted RNA-binding Zn-ribbon protein involved in translation (DUF1610 family)
MSTEANALEVPCPWCDAKVGQQCDDKGRPGGYRGPAKPHPSRVLKAKLNRQYETTKELKQRQSATRVAGPVNLDELFLFEPVSGPVRLGRHGDAEKVVPTPPQKKAEPSKEAEKRAYFKKKYVKKVDCPKCGSPAGKRCRDLRTLEDSYYVSKFHKERVELAKAQFGEPKTVEPVKTEEPSAKSYPLRCPLCASDTPAEIRLSKKNRPYISCAACHSLSYINTPAGLSELEKAQPGPVLELLHDLSPSWRDSLEKIIKAREKAAI